MEKGRRKREMGRKKRKRWGVKIDRTWRKEEESEEGKRREERREEGRWGK